MTNQLKRLNAWAGSGEYSPRMSAQSYFGPAAQKKAAASCGSGCGSGCGAGRPAPTPAPKPEPEPTPPGYGAR